MGDVVIEYPNEVRIEREIDEFGETYLFKAPMFETQEFKNQGLAELYADVYFAQGFREEDTGRRGVPPAIAKAPTHILAAYLVTQRGYSIDWIVTSWDLSEETVRSYISRTRGEAMAGREKAREQERRDE